MKRRAILDHVKAYPERTRMIPGTVRLDLNENMYGCSSRVMDILRSLTPSQISEYPDVSGLKRVICEKYNLEKKQVALANGGDEAIRYVMDAFVEQGDRVVLTEPGFSMYTQYAALRESDIVRVPLNRDLTFPDSAFIRESRNAALCVIVNPNTPTGTALNSERISNIIESLPNTVILLDEAYTEFRNVSDIDLIKEYPNLIVLRSLSKAYGLAGLRLGFLVGSVFLMNAVRKVSAPFNVNSVAAVLGQEAMKDCRFLRQTVKTIQKNREYLTCELSKLGLKVLPSDSNFVTVYFNDGCSNMFSRLMTHGILVKNLSGFTKLNGWLRITVGTEEQCRSVVEIISSVCPLEAVLFDMDGVLVDVSLSYRKAITATVDHFTRQQVSVREIETLKNKGGYNCDWALTECLITKKGGNVSFSDVKTVFQDFYLGKNGVPGLIENEKWMITPEILNELKSRFKLGIVTGRPIREARSALEKAGVSQYFQTVIAREDTEDQGKPDPLGIQMAMSQLKVKRALYVGDTVDDMKAASLAGIPSIGVASGNGDYLKNNGAFDNISYTKTLKEVLL